MALQWCLAITDLLRADATLDFCCEPSGAARDRHGTIRALAEVDYTVAPGEIVGLIGDNGAGKSTLVKIIAGNIPPTHGTMHFDGREVRFRGPEDARNAGIEVVYQDLALCDNLSGAANVFLGRELRRRVASLSILNHAAMIRRAAQLFAELRW